MAFFADPAKCDFRNGTSQRRQRSIVIPIATPRRAATGPRQQASIEGPAKKRKAPIRKQLENDELARLNEIQAIICKSLDDDKAEDIVVLDLVGRAAFVDRMVIATGLADRQIVAMATHVEEKLKEAGLRNITIEGAAGADWVLLDAGDILVHLFKAEARGTYGLEKMWSPELDEPARD